MNEVNIKLNYYQANLKNLNWYNFTVIVLESFELIIH